MSDYNQRSNDLPLATQQRTAVLVDDAPPKTSPVTKWDSKNTGQALESAGKVVEVVKVFADITKVDTEGRNQVNAIDAETRQMEIRIRGEIDRLRETGYTLRNRGLIAQELVDGQLKFLNNPDLPESVKEELVKGLSKVIEATLNEAMTEK